MSKNNQLKVKAVYPDQKTAEFVSAAVSLVNHYRLLRGMNIMAESTFVMNSTIAAANDVFKFHKDQVDAANKDQVTEEGAVDDGQQESPSV